MYSGEELQSMAGDKQKWSSAANDLLERFAFRKYRAGRSLEYARHGLARRVRALVHLTDSVFSIIPPDTRKTPAREMLNDAEAFIQSFLVNVYGAIDNMARIWCFEADVRDKKGVFIKDRDIGFRPSNKVVRESLPKELPEHLTKCDQWFTYLENYRHAVAHRIPVYIPSATLSEEDAAKDQRIEEEIGIALKDHDLARWRVLMAEKESLGTFKPIIMHSYGEKARPIALHGQMICDLATVVEIGEMLLKALPEK